MEVLKEPVVQHAERVNSLIADGVWQLQIVALIEYVCTH